MIRPTVAPPEPLCLVAGADATYALPLAVTLHSALRHLNRDRAVEVIIADGGLGNQNRDRIVATLRRAHPKATILFVTPSMERLAGLNSGIYSPSSYLRLLTPEFVGAHQQRVLYLDSDILVTDDLAPLWDFDMAGLPLWAVQNFSDGSHGRALRKALAERGQSDDCLYFNSGVLLINLPVWRAEAVSERAFAFLDHHSQTLSFPDQDALNIAVAARWGQLDPRWNIQISNLGIVPRLAPPSQGAADADAMRALRGICHFTVAKPWQRAYTGKLAAAWQAEALRLGWQNPLVALPETLRLLLRQALSRNCTRLHRRIGWPKAQA